MQETYATYVVRSVLEVCSGVEIDKKLKASNKAQSKHELKTKATEILSVPDDLLQVFNDILARLTQLPNITGKNN